MRDKFVAKYSGGRVDWSGTVKSARAYENDHDFGRGPGVKAVVTATVARLTSIVTSVKPLTAIKNYITTEAYGVEIETEVQPLTDIEPTVEPLTEIEDDISG